MNENIIELVLRILNIVALSLGLVFTLGIVWRTEKKLDLTYKLLFVAVLAFLSARVLSVSYFLDSKWQLWIDLGLDFLGTLFSSLEYSREKKKGP